MKTKTEKERSGGLEKKKSASRTKDETQQQIYSLQTAIKSEDVTLCVIPARLFFFF